MTGLSVFQRDRTRAHGGRLGRNRSARVEDTINDRTNGSVLSEVEFTLPLGYSDETGVLHRDGRMRRATAADEILPMRDPRVQQNPAYLPIIVLSLVITKLGDLPMITTRVIEGLY